MMGNRVITIGRQYGSNGRIIDQKLAERLGIHYYDRELVDLAGQNSSIPYEELRKVDEKRANPWRYPVEDDVQMERRFRFEPMNDVLFSEQSKVIRDLAKKEDCVIVGRCADYVLRAYPSCIKVFIYGALEERIKVIMERASVDEKEAATLIRKMDKQRRYYYNYYTDEKWGDLSRYDLSVDSCRFGIEGTLDILEAAYRTGK